MCYFKKPSFEIPVIYYFLNGSILFIDMCTNTLSFIKSRKNPVQLEAWGFLDFPEYDEVFSRIEFIQNKYKTRLYHEKAPV